MAETVVIGEYNGSPKAFASLANKIARLCTIDLAEPGTDNSCKIPTAPAIYHPYWKSFSAHFSGDFGQVTNITVNGDGNFATDWGLKPTDGGKVVIGYRLTGDNGCPLASYQQALGSPGVTGYAIDDGTNGHAYYKNPTYGGVMDFDDCDPSAPLLVDSGPYTAEFYSKIWVMSAVIVSTADYGAKTPKSITVGYTIF
jgi:hypothetical protein